MWLGGLESEIRYRTSSYCLQLFYAQVKLLVTCNANILVCFFHGARLMTLRCVAVSTGVASDFLVSQADDAAQPGRS